MYNFTMGPAVQTEGEGRAGGGRGRAAKSFGFNQRLHTLRLTSWHDIVLTPLDHALAVEVLPDHHIILAD